MKRTVWTFGLIAGAVLSGMMLVTMSLVDQIGFGKGEIIGYTTMVVAFLMAFFGIRSYRDNVLDGTIGFARAFQVGILITAIASLCYVATWEVIYYRMMPDFGAKYAAHMLEKAKADGATQQQLDAQLQEMKKFQELYKNPFVNAAITFVEPFPVGLVITLVCAGILKRKRREPSGRVVAGLSG
ncbi:MAG: DUF4199 domain-containing protein [bacterium]